MSNNNHKHSCTNHSHSHNHEHGHGCGCHSHGGNNKCCGKHKKIKIEDISDTQVEFLMHLIESKFLPVASFVLKSSKEHDFESIALAPVFIIDVKDSMQEVKNVANKLKSLENLGLITIDYDIELNGYSYAEYHSSEIYAYFKKTVNESKGKDGFIGDVPTIECGSIAPTEKCIEMLKK